MSRHQTPDSAGLCGSVFFLFFAVHVEGVRIPGVEFSFSFNLIPGVGFYMQRPNARRRWKGRKKGGGGCGGRNFLLLDFESGSEAM